VKAPQRVSFEQFIRDLRDWREDRTCEDGITCRHCDEPIAERIVYLSIHDSRFEACAGPGQVLKVVLPYCPSCEELDRAGCLHIPLTEGT